MMRLRTGEQYMPEQVLPHRAAMLLADAVSYGEDYGEIRWTVRPDSLLVDPQHGQPSWVGIEHMAQAMSVFSGIECVQKGGSVSIGLLIGTRRFDAFCEHFPIGATLTARARLTFFEAPMFVFDCEIREGTRVLAHGDIKAFRPDNVKAFLKLP